MLFNMLKRQFLRDRNVCRTKGSQHFNFSRRHITCLLKVFTLMVDGTDGKVATKPEIMNKMLHRKGLQADIKHTSSI